MRRLALYIPWFLVGAILMFAALWALGLLPSAHVKYCYTNQTHQEECATYNIALVLIWEIGKFLNWISAAVTAVATAVLAFITRRLVKLGRDQSKTTRAQLRAYVYATPFRAFNVDKFGAPVQTYTTIINKGATSAHKIQRWVGINLLRGPVPENFEDLGPLKREEGTYVLPPDGQGFVIQKLRPITDGELADLMTETGDLQLYAFGKITYEDEFGNPHWTTFCHVYFGPERLDRGADRFAYESWQAKFSDHHNETDREISTNK